MYRESKLMKDNWYIRSPRGVTGPISHDALIARLNEGEILESTPVRQGIGGPWRELREALSSAEDSTIDSTEAARRALRAMEDGPIGFGTPRSPASVSGPFAAIASLFERLAGLLSDALGWIATIVGRYVSARGALLVIFLVCAILLLRASPLMDTSLVSAHAVIERIWSDANELRDAKANESEWEAFRQKSLAELEPIAESLSKTNDRPPGIWALLGAESEAEQEARHDLIQLTRNEIPASLNAGIEGDALHEARIAKWLDRVRDYHDGQNPYSAVTGPNQETPESSGDLWTPIIIGADVLIVLGLAYFFLRRR